MTMRNTLAAAAAAVALLTITACGQSAGPPTTAAPSAATSSPPTCRQQYGTWKHGPAGTTAKTLESALTRVQSAANAEDIPGLDSALAAAGKSARALRAEPMPRCADPRGYYGQFLARITAAGDNAKSGGSGFGALLLAVGPLKTVPGIEKKLSTELARTAGKH